MRRRFITGLAVSLPVVTTFVVIWLFVQFIAGWSVELLKLIPVLKRVPGPILLLVGLLILIVLVYLMGILAASYLGRRLLRWAEKLLTRPPVIKTIYNAIRQVVNSVLVDKRQSFRSVVLVQFPYRDSWALGFITNPEPWVIDGKEHANVYVPTMPNPTSGWYLIVPTDEVIPLEMTVEEGLKIVISGGLVKDRRGFPEVERKNVQDI